VGVYGLYALRPSVIPQSIRASQNVDHGLRTLVISPQPLLLLVETVLLRWAANINGRVNYTATQPLLRASM
jgi:hypothetical protein